MRATTLATLVLARVAVAQTTGGNPSHEDILRGFDIAALYADTSQGSTGYGSGATMTGTLSKWDRPILYSLDGLLYDQDRIAETIGTLRRIAGIAGIVVKEAADSKDANLGIVFRNTDNLRTSNGGKVGCLTNWKIDDWTGRINSVDIQINLADVGSISQCITHELLHAFGLRGHPHKLHSILSYYTTRIVFDLTEADVVMLQTLYDPRMKLGMPRLAAVVLADGIIEEKRRALNTSAPARTDAAPVFRDITASIEKEAEAGKIRAMLHLAEAYRAGTGVASSKLLSRQWLRRATAHPDPAQRFDAAYALQFGRILPRNLAEAVLIYDGIAREGIYGAQNNLGFMLWNGHGVPADKIEALKWFLVAAQAGHAVAAKNRDRLRADLTAEEREEAERRAAAWKPLQQAAK